MSEDNIDAILSRVAQGLKKARLDSVFTQAFMGRALGITFQQWQKYESGENQISLKKLILACQVFNINIGDFFEECINPKNHSTIEELANRVQLNQETIDAINAPYEDYTEYKI